jgi:hypothetical protein
VFSDAPAEAHAKVLRRITATGKGSIGVTSFDTTSEGVYWQLGDPLAASESEPLQFTCYTSATGFAAQVDWFDQPTLPATFEGDAGPNAAGDSRVQFDAPGAGQYVAELTLTGGAVQLASINSFRSQTFASSGTFQIGTLPAGSNGLRILAQDGPAAHWRVRISALPVAVSDAKFSSTVIRCCDATSLGYATSGDTRVTVSIVNAYGVSVRVLASDFPVSSGSHSLIWDGRDANGNPVADGVYTAVIGRHDPSGASGTSYSAPVTVDSTAPTATLSAGRVGLTDSLVVNVADASSGLDTASARVDDGYSRYLDTGASSIVLSPSSEWTAGAHAVSVAVRDNAGNAATIPLSFVAGVAPTRSLPTAVPKAGTHPALTRTIAVKALRAAIHKRLRGYKVAAATCRATSSRAFSCRFMAKRRGRRTVRGSGTISQAAVNAVARYRFIVRRAGSSRRTIWRGTA